ncbi:RNA polymerase sigma-70 factor (ECF subfamily) [Catenuloplanes nepalensis]|uniref:RNA polymerase sigma factor n=1 Tax=Catenuloplanes nepalensis TaxID=587533 RepID=A0ABT9MWW0_9ACTN|nr:sigma-70 family RNA polymerase sigma factor [Catenuloplanes nepalensis]MDP9795917.1 RNA polymerase sigma-70 factor (ECF subfamily) [Catenuloplanes nepalensis]
MHTSGPDEAELTTWALRAGKGDRAAASDFVRATQQGVHRFLAHLVSPGEAEDLAQETYLRAMRALPSFAARSSARTWLLAIARRVAADHIRSVVARPRTAALENWELAADAAMPGSDVADGVVLDHLLRGLDPERREAFVATQVLGLSYQEAAEVCGCPIGTIRSRVARAREDLVAALGHRRAAHRATS